MFEFKRRNPDKLEGRVLVYAENLALCGSPNCTRIKYPTLYSALNPAEIGSMGEILRKNLPEEILKEAEADMPREILKMIDSAKVYPISSTKGALNNLDELKDMEIDIINGGKVGCMSVAFPNLISLTQSYMLNYITQLEEELKTNGGIKPTFTDHYSTYSSEQFRKKMYEFVGALMDASGDNQRFSQIKSNIVAFTKKSPFLSDVVNLVGIAQTEIPDKFDLMNFYIEKMAAIHEEDFEKAGEFNKKIDKFLRR